MKSIDLNCDLGECDGQDGLDRDLAILPFVSSINIACGYHAGDKQRMEHLVRAASELPISIGAHPGYRDRPNFGRRYVPLAASEVRALVLEQLDFLARIMQKEVGKNIDHVKPHGALYNRAAVDGEVAEAIVDAVLEFNQATRSQCALYGLADSQFVSIANAKRLRTFNEVFADRNYLADKTLVPRDRPDAILYDSSHIARRMIDWLQTGIVAASDGSLIALRADTVCLHGDHPSSAENARQLRAELEGAGIRVRHLSQR